MKRTVLIADDDVSVQESLAQVLREEGYEVLCGRDGNEAVRQAITRLPDLVLLDLHMPNRDGWQVFDVLERLCPLLPVIVITARPNQYPRAVGLGVDALMEKPLDIPILLKTMQRLLAESERDRVRRLTRGDFKTAFLGTRPVTEEFAS